MNTRERTLAVIVGALLGLFGLRAIHGRLNNMVETRARTLAAVQNQLDVAHDELDNAERAIEKLGAWQARSLPTDQETALSLYHHRIVEELTKADLTNIEVTRAAPVSVREEYAMLTLNVNADGSLDNLSSFLFEFYRADFLHKIRSLDLVPRGSENLLRIKLELEALILPGAELNDSLPSRPSNRLAHDDLAEYRESIVGRNLFAAYTPLRKPRPEPVATAVSKTKPKPRFDDATKAFVTGIVERKGKLEAWILVRTTGETVRLMDNAEFQIGLMEGRVAGVRPKAIILKTDEGTFQIALGKNLREGERLETEPGS